MAVEAALQERLVQRGAAPPAPEIAWRRAARAGAVWCGEHLIYGDRRRFEEELAALIEPRLAEWGQLWLTVRDMPDDMLTEALDRAGIKFSRLPGDRVLPQLHVRIFRDRIVPIENGLKRPAIPIRQG